jgi:hypothetical protein
LQAVAATWPGVPHQICPFHALREAGRVLYEREAGRVLYERDRAIKVHLRTALQPRIRTVRRQLDRRAAADAPGPDGPDADEAAYARILAEYAAGVQALINRDGLQPFRFGAVAMDDALGAVEQSLARLAKAAKAKKGEPSPPGVRTG